jgi:hypothetical protein
LSDLVPDKQRPWKWLKQALYCLVCKSLSWFLTDWVLKCTVFSQMLPRFPIGLFKICLSLGLVKFWRRALSGTGLPLWWEGLPVIGVSGTYTVFTHSLTLSWFTPPSLSFFISYPSPNMLKPICKQAARVKCLALKMDYYWLYF